jgi:hypothetical protein
MSAYDACKAIICGQLQEQGWKPWEGANDKIVATKTYQSVVGPKQAGAFLSDWAEDNDFALSGEYDSEGRNILNTSLVRIPKDSDEQTIRELTSRFAEDVDSRVSQSYAVRLMPKEQEQEEGSLRLS